MTRTLFTTFAAASLMSLSACAMVQSVPAARAAVSEEAASLDAPLDWVFGEVVGQQQDKKIAASWSDIVSDPMLDTHIEAALRQNQSLRAAAQNVERSAALLRQSRSNLLPTIGYDAGTSAGSTIEGRDFTDSYNAGLGASWEADLWGEIRADVLGAEFDVAAARATFGASRQALIAAVARAYFGVIQAEQTTALTEQTLAALEETLRIVQVRYDLGAASRRELVLATADVASARDGLVLAQSARVNAAMGLQVLLGQYPDADIQITSDFPEIAAAVTAGQPADILRRRPDVVAAEMAVLSAFQATRIAESANWPDLILSGGLDTRTADPTDILDPTSIGLSLGLRLVGTLFDGGFNAARLDASTASQRQALATFGQTVLDAYFDVETALEAIQTLDQRAVHVAASAEAARETLALAEVQYKQGAIDLIDVLSLQQRSFQADQTIITLRRQVLDAKVTLYLSLGGAYTEYRPPELQSSDNE